MAKDEQSEPRRWPEMVKVRGAGWRYGGVPLGAIADGSRLGVLFREQFGLTALEAASRPGWSPGEPGRVR